MEISLDKFIGACKEMDISESKTIQLINKLFMDNESDSKQTNSKDVAMKVANNYTWGNHDQRPDGNCPVCNYNLSGNSNSPKYERCPSCNQKLDWH